MAQQTRAKASGRQRKQGVGAGTWEDNGGWAAGGQYAYAPLWWGSQSPWATPGLGLVGESKDAGFVGEGKDAGLVGESKDAGEKEEGTLCEGVERLFATATNFNQVHQSMMAPPAQPPTAEGILGDWSDSLGNKVQVFSTDAYEVRLMATLSRPPRPDIYLQVCPMLGGGWQCGNSILDLYWSSAEELHWVTSNGRVSVWVRGKERPDGNKGQQAPIAETTPSDNVP
mmetsp:Transcript_39909/g.109821  ORF Transcript_39909/g.109821 Transcript_39909/m.109821 type:complete len:227 (-) Transcript_39909:130-810(-)